MTPFGAAIFVLILTATAVWVIRRRRSGLARRRFGFNPLVVAFLWAGFELGLVKFGFADGLFGEAQFTSSFFHSIATLFGFLIVALIVVLVNSLLVVALEAAVSFARARGHAVTEGKRNWDLIPSPGLLAQRLHWLSMLRAPPG